MKIEKKAIEPEVVTVKAATSDEELAAFVEELAEPEPIIVTPQVGKIFIPILLVKGSSIQIMLKNVRNILTCRYVSEPKDCFANLIPTANQAEKIIFNGALWDVRYSLIQSTTTYVHKAGFEWRTVQTMSGLKALGLASEHEMAVMESVSHALDNHKFI